MSSSLRTRRRRQQQSLHRHRLRLEDLEKRYALDASGLSNDTYAFWSEGGSLYRSSVTSPQVQEVIASGVGKFDIDQTNGHIYVETVPTNPGNAQIYRYDLDGSNQVSVYSGSELGQVNYSLAVDAVNRSVYLHSHDPAPVAASGPHFDGKIQQIDIDAGTVSFLPHTTWYSHDMEVDALSSQLFYTRNEFSDSGSKLFSSDLDGANYTEVNFSVGAPHNIALDSINSVIYFTSGVDHQSVYSAPKNGGTATLVTTLPVDVDDIEFNAATQSLYYATQNGIYSSPIDGASTQIISRDSSTSELAIVTVASPKPYLYWTESGKVFRSPASPMAPEEIIGSGVDKFDVDEANGHIYVASLVPNPGNTKIYRYDLDGTNETLVYGGNELGQINYSLSVNASAGFVYLHSHDPAPVSSSGPHFDGKIQRISIDTGEVSLLPQTSLYSHDIESNKSTGHLYYTSNGSSSSSSKLYRSGVDGSGYTEIPVSSGAPHDIALDTDNGTFYYSSGTDMRSIYSAPLSGGPATLITTVPSTVWDIEYDSATQTLYYATQNGIYSGPTDGASERVFDSNGSVIFDLSFVGVQSQVGLGISVNSAFGSGGSGQVHIGQWGKSFLLKDGRIAVTSAGTQTESGYLGTVDIIRPDGTTDTSVGNAGRIQIDLPGINYAKGFSEQNDGKWLVAGTGQYGPGDDYWSVTRVLTDGSLDTSFADNGTFILDSTFHSGTVRGFYAEQLTNGRIIATGALNGGSRLGVVSLTADGNLNSDFGTNGILNLDIGNSGGFVGYSTVFPNDDGTFWVSSVNEYQSGAGRRWHTILIDDTGSVLTQESILLGDSARTDDMIRDVYGRFVGTAVDGTDLIITRQLNNGVVDNSFGDNGVLRISNAASPMGGQGIASLHDGRLLVGCLTDNYEKVHLRVIGNDGVVQQLVNGSEVYEHDYGYRVGGDHLWLDVMTASEDTVFVGTWGSEDGIYKYLSYSIENLPINGAPTLDVINNTTVSEDFGTATIQLTGITAGPNEIQNIRVNAVSSDPSLVTIGTVNQAPRSGAVEWTTADGGNGHFYEHIPDFMSWDDAQAYATARGGYLATVTTEAEDNFVYDMLPIGEGGPSSKVEPFLGGYQDLTADDYSEPLGGWRWVTGETWAYEDWNADGIPVDPNNASGIEHKLFYVGQGGRWGDSAGLRSFVIEYDSQPYDQSLELVSQPNQHGVATVTVTVEDGGLDNAIGTPGDNATFSRTFDVTVTPVNDSPAGEVTIDGDPTQNVVLSANTSTIQDEDGLGEFAYQWLRDGTPVSGANSSTHALTQVDVGTQISVRVDYTDNEGTAESLTSAQTSAVVNVNDAPVLDPAASPQLSVINEDAGVPVGQVGTLVSDLIDTGGVHNNFSDIDGDLPGIAITGTNLESGSLWFSNNDGSTWLDVGAVSEASPRLLFADATTRLYYEPAADFSGSISDVITMRAWDRTLALSQIGGNIQGPASGSRFGLSVATSGNGTVMIAGAPNAQGPNGPASGTAVVHYFNGHSWVQKGSMLVGDNSNDYFGRTVAISDDGDTVAVAANGHSDSRGQIKVFRWNSEAWEQLGQDFVGDQADDRLNLMSLSHDGNRLITGATHADANSTNSGNTRVYEWSGSTWQQLGNDISGAGFSQESGRVSISSDGSTIAIGADQNKDRGWDVGHVRIYRWNNNQWEKLGSDIYGEAENDRSGHDVSLSANGDIVAIGAYKNDGFAQDAGHVRVFAWNETDWIQVGGDIDGEEFGEISGVSVSLSNAGDRLAIGAQNFNGAAGIARVYHLKNSQWHKIDQIVGNEDGERAGFDVSLSGDGKILSIGVPNGSNSAESGHVRIFSVSPHANSISVNFDIVSIDVTPVNDSPTLNPISDLVLPEDSLTQFVRLSGVTAGGGEAQPLRVTATSSNPSLLINPAVTSIVDLGVDNRLLGFTPLPDQYGIATITVTVEDGGLDLDLDTADDNATFSETFDVTVTPDTDDPPSLVTSHGKMFIHETLSGDPLISYQLPAVNVNGEAINGLLNRITTTSSDTALIPDPTVLYASADVPSSLSFTPVANANGTATLSIQVEDGGPDNDFATTEDNRQATHQVEVTVLEVISNQNSAILAKDNSENLYVNTQPVVYHDQQQAQSTIAGFAAIGASSEDGENALLVERNSVTNRLVTDDAWRINGLFDSLQNESSSVLDLSAREVSGTLNIAAVAGAYEINGVNNPTLIVRRGQTYTFNLNTAGHPFYLQTTGGGYQSANVYSNGFTGNSQTTGEHQWVVPQDAPEEIFYQCKFHSVMFGKIIVVD